MTGDYTLKVRVDHMRRNSMAGLLFSLAQQALISERKGETFEQVHAHLTGDGDYSAIAVVYPADEDRRTASSATDTELVPALSGTMSELASENRRLAGSDGMAEDDITAAEEARNGAQREADEAARLRRIEAAKQADRERWSK